MRAAVYDGSGGLEVLSVRELPDPAYGTDEILVDVAYAGLNRADILERAGQYGGVRAPQVVPGLEFSGEVRALGSSVTALSVGERVCGIVPTGAHAERLVAHALAVARIPDEVDFARAAAIPEAFLTAYDALFTLGRLEAGCNVLVHAVGSSVGLAAAALAKRSGAFVVGTSRTKEKLERARALGLIDVDLVLDDGWLGRALAATGGRGADIVLDFIGAPELDHNIMALAGGGRIVQIGTLGGSKATLHLGALMGKRGSLIGTMLRLRPIDEKIALARLLAKRILPMFARGELSVVIDSIFPLDRIAEAHAYMEANDNFGKILVAMSA